MKTLRKMIVTLVAVGILLAGCSSAKEVTTATEATEATTATEATEVTTATTATEATEVTTATTATTATEATEVTTGDTTSITVDGEVVTVVFIGEDENGKYLYEDTLSGMHIHISEQLEPGNVSVDTLSEDWRDIVLLLAKRQKKNK